MDSSNMDTKEKGLAATDVKGDVGEYEDPEYSEYLASAEDYSGDKLKKLTVSSRTPIRIHS
jgi:hypothetical protein